ncbi:MAG: hypothetical protein ACR2OE_03720 [Thermomicrobiales bacterium]
MSVAMVSNEKRMGSGRRRQRWALALALALALVGAVGIGAIAGWAGDHAFWPTFAVFAIATFPVIAGLSWLVIVQPVDPDAQPSEHAEESIEAAWAKQAGYGAFLDLIVVLGLATTATAILDRDSLPSVLFLAIGIVDWLLRSLILKWRER